MSDVTRILSKIEAGEPSAAQSLLPLVLIQPDIVWENPAANRAQYEKSVLAHASAGSVVILPEMCEVGFTMNAHSGVDADTSSQNFFGSLARQTRSHLIAGLVLPSPEKPTNSAVVFAPDGSLNVTLERHVVRWAKPVIYQETSPGVRQTVAGSYRLADDAVGFTVSGYDRRLPLVIDPVVSYSTFLGRNSNEGIFAVAVDGSGNTYSAGITTSVSCAVSALTAR